MSYNKCRPFRTLAEEFAAKAGKTSGVDGGSSSTHVSARQEDADAALFLDAMRRIRPLAGDGRGGGQRTLAESLAAKMQADAWKNLFGGGMPPSPGGKRSGRKAGSVVGREEKISRGNLYAVAPQVEQTSPANGQGCEENFTALLAASERNTSRQELDDEELSLFAKAMRDVVPVSGKGRDVVSAVRGGGVAVPVDPAKALRDVLEGRVEFALRHTDEYMEGFVVGVDPLVLARLKNGQYSPEGHVDLHGMNARQAYDALVFFIKNAYQRGLRAVVVVTGRGRNSPDGIGVLRGMLQRWLCRDPFKRVVLAFCTAKPEDGGPGAAYVLLRKYKKSRGKIIWEHMAHEENFPDV